MTAILMLSIAPCIALAVLTVVLLKPQPVKVRVKKRTDTSEVR